MKEWSLRRRLTILGMLATLGPLLVLFATALYSFTNVVVEEETDTGAEIEESTTPRMPNVVPITAAALGVVAVFTVRMWATRATRPIDDMTRAVDEVQSGSLDRRVKLQRAPAEVASLATSFNRMLDRLESASEVERRLIEDASHELRTPLAAVAARLEVAAQRNDVDAMRDDIRLGEEQVHRLATTLDSLLASARDRRLRAGQVDNDLVEIINRVVEQQQLVHDGAIIHVTAPARLRLGIDGSLVERAVSNLIDNAIAHGGGTAEAGGATHIVLVETQDLIELSVTDEGPGIPPDHLGSVFDRYHGDHHGIGLALVKHVADAHLGVTVESPVRNGRGTRFTMRFAQPQPSGRGR